MGNILGTICPGGPNWLGTICPRGPNFWGPFVQGDRIGWGPFVQRDQSIGDQLWGTKCLGTICVWDQMCHSPIDSCPQNSTTEFMLTFVIYKRINVTSRFIIKVVHSSKFFWIEKRFWFRVILFGMTLETWFFPCSLVQVNNFQKVFFLKVSYCQNASLCLKFSKKQTQKFDEFLP